MNDDINTILEWRRTLPTRIRAGDPQVVDPQMPPEEREKMAQELECYTVLSRKKGVVTLQE